MRRDAAARWNTSRCCARASALPPRPKCPRCAACRCTRWPSRPGRGSFSTARAMRCSRSVRKCRRRRTSACALRATAWSRAFTTGRPSGCTSSRRSHPARSACFSTTAAPISNSSGATDGAFGCTRSTRPITIWRSRTPFPARARESRVLTKSRKLPAELRFRREFSHHASFQCSSRSPSSATVCATAAAPAVSSSPGSA